MFIVEIRLVGKKQFMEISIKENKNILLTSLFVPTSSVMGKQYCGGTPANAVYKLNLPIVIPIPLQPKSPKPNIRSPSVTTIA